MMHIHSVQAIAHIQDLGRFGLRRLQIENEGHVFRAFQHNPSFEYAKLHDHPIAVHTDAIEKNLVWAEETWTSLKKNLPADSPEARQMGEIQPLYNKFIDEGLRPAIARLKAGDYSADGVGAFLQANAKYGTAMNKAFLAGIALQGLVLLAPPLQGAFSVVPMPLPQWGIVLGLAVTPLVVCEIEKAVRRARTGRPAPVGKEAAVYR